MLACTIFKHTISKQWFYCQIKLKYIKKFVYRNLVSNKHSMLALTYLKCTQPEGTKSKLFESRVQTSLKHIIVFMFLVCLFVWTIFFFEKIDREYWALKTQPPRNILKVGFDWIFVQNVNIFVTYELLEHIFFCYNKQIIRWSVVQISDFMFWLFIQQWI